MLLADPSSLEVMSALRTKCCISGGPADDDDDDDDNDDDDDGDDDDDDCNRINTQWYNA